MPRPIYIIVKLRTSILPPLKIIAAIHLFLSLFPFFSSLLLSFTPFPLFFLSFSTTTSAQWKRRPRAWLAQPTPILFTNNRGMERDERLLSSFEMCARPNELQVIGFFSSPWISAEKFPIRRLMPVLSVEEFSEKNEGRKRDEHRWVRFTSSVVFPFFFFWNWKKEKIRT